MLKRQRTELKMKTLKPEMLKLVKRKKKPLRVGFLPVNDCAPLAVAREFGLFEKYGLSVELERESSWKELHEQLVFRQIEAAHASAALPFLMRMGVTPEQAPCVTGLVLSLQGSAVTISEALWRKGVHDAEGLGKLILRDKGRRVYTFAVDLPFSSDYFLLCHWLRLGGLTPLRTVRIIKVAPSEMFPMLKLGYLDGYCVGEPWTTVAVQSGVGRCVATSAQLAPLHPEKILLVREDFAERRADEHERMVAALIEACAFCDKEENRAQLCEILAQPDYVNAPMDCLQSGLMGPFDPDESEVHSLRGLNIFQSYRANDPTASRAGWVTGQLHHFFRWKTKPTGFAEIFRRDIYHRARKRLTGGEQMIGAQESSEAALTSVKQVK
jgi:ABC-type nitrate/sulfonate/bicarbonate transport system substrate-binding protein